MVLRRALIAISFQDVLEKLRRSFDRSQVSGTLFGKTKPRLRRFVLSPDGSHWGL